MKQGFHHYNTHFESDTTIYENDRYWNKVVTLLIMTTGLAMLIGPLWILDSISNDSKKRLGVITAFVVAFTVLLSSVTVAKHFEVLAATAGESYWKDCCRWRQELLTRDSICGRSDGFSAIWCNWK